MSTQVLLAVLLLACLASFAWAMRNFFMQPAGKTAGMRIVSFSGLACGVLHLLSILTAASIPQPRAIAAAILYIASLGLFWWAIRTSLSRPLSAIFSPDEPVHLVQEGPYRFVRHPLYCSYLTVWAAGTLATEHVWLVPTVVAMILIYLSAARMEEKKFSRTPLAGEYQQYRSRTGLLAPNPIKLILALRSR